MDVINFDRIESRDSVVTFFTVFTKLCSASAGKTYIKMQNQLLNDDDCACFLVEAIAKESQNIKWTTTVDGKKVSHSEIEVICDCSLNYQFAKHDFLFVNDSNGDKLLLDSDYVLSGKSQIINVETRIKVECILFRKGLYHDSYCISKEKQNISIEINAGDLLEIRDDYALLGTIRIVSDIKEKIGAQQLMDYEKDKWVNLPIWYKKVCLIHIRVL